MKWLFLSSLLPATARLHTYKPTNTLLTRIVLNTQGTFIPYTLQATSSSLCMPRTPHPETKLSTKSWHKEAPTRKSAQKKIGRGQHMSSQCTTPRKTTVPTKQIGSLLQLRRGGACSCVWMHVMHFAVQCVYTRVTYNTTQVKIGQNSRRAAWADLGVAPRVYTVVSISSDMTGPGPVFFGGFIIFQVQVMRLEG